MSPIRQYCHHHLVWPTHLPYNLCIYKLGINYFALFILAAPPDPPTNLALRHCDGLEAGIFWTAARSNYHPITKYLIEASTTFKPGHWDFLNETSGKTSISFNLSPWANYTFRVRAENRLGVSDPSLPTSAACKTPQKRPNKHPSNVKIPDNKAGYLVIQWNVSFLYF